MEQTIQIKGLRWYPQATEYQLEQWKAELAEKNCGTLLVVPAPADTSQYLGVLLEDYYTEALSGCLGVRGTTREDRFVYLTISGTSVRGFVSSIMRKLRPYCPTAVSESSGDGEFQLLPHEMEWIEETRPDPVKSFLQTQTPAEIQRQLQEYVIGQPELTRAVADFLYYHGLRQIHPQLPQRPLMIAGPSGSGKTEVWRVARRLFGHLFPIRIIDGSNLSCEGWSGNYKLDTYMDATIVRGGILVVDEFDKLARPKHGSRGDNVSLDLQAEFLKLMEGEYRVTENRKQTPMTSEKMGFVLVGAFESLRAKKQEQAEPRQNPIGFCAQSAPRKTMEPLSDEDFIAYGIMPEVVGRIAVKCQARHLTDKAYLDIIRGPNSRVAQLSDVLGSYGVAVSDVISAKALSELIAASKANCTGVRWVSAQVESRLLEAIYDQGLHMPRDVAS